MAMQRRKEPQPNLSLISDEYGRAGQLGRVRVVAAPEHAPPFAVDALAVEEDTHLLLSTEGEIREPEESLESLVEAAQKTPANFPGNVLVRTARPLQLLAIVHDVDRQPTWREDWIASAIHATVEEAEWRRLKSLGLPLVGTRHGSIEPRRVAGWLGSCLSRASFRYLKRIWLIVPSGAEAELMNALRSEISP